MPSVPEKAVRRRVVGTSTKMYFDYARMQDYARNVTKLLNEHPAFPLAERSGDQALDLFVIPDFVSIIPVQHLLQECTSKVWVGAQDTSDKDEGALTGEVSPRTLAQAGCKLVEIGHAERRSLFGETNPWVASKAGAIVRNGMIPLVCVGEVTQPDNDTELAVSECWEQIGPVLDAIPDTADVILAYEPVWAIGKPEPASASHIVAVTQAMRQRCLDERPGRTDASLRIVYGGSAKPGLYEHIYEGVDGLFLGRFAHDPAQFVKTIHEVYTAGRTGA